MCQYLDQYKEKQHYHAQEYIGFRQASANTAECVKKQQYLMRTSAKHVIHDTAKKSYTIYCKNLLLEIGKEVLDIVQP